MVLDNTRFVNSHKDVLQRFMENLEEYKNELAELQIPAPQTGDPLERKYAETIMSTDLPRQLKTILLTVFLGEWIISQTKAEWSIVLLSFDELSTGMGVKVIPQQSWVPLAGMVDEAVTSENPEDLGKVLAFTRIATSSELEL